MQTDRTRGALLGAMLLGVSLTACSIGGSGNMGAVAAPAPVTAPTRFVPLDAANLIAPTDTTAGSGCLSPLRDPAKDIQIILIRSESGLGDYLAPSGSYGIPDGKLLRIDCNTGSVVGLVRR